MYRVQSSGRQILTPDLFACLAFGSSSNGSSVVEVMKS